LRVLRFNSGKSARIIEPGGHREPSEKLNDFKTGHRPGWTAGEISCNTTNFFQAPNLRVL